MKAHEISLGNHHGVSTVAVMCRILDLFGENVASIDGTSNVKDTDVVVDNGFADFAFA